MGQTEEKTDSFIYICLQVYLDRSMVFLYTHHPRPPPAQSLSLIFHGLKEQTFYMSIKNGSEFVLLMPRFYQRLMGNKISPSCFMRWLICNQEHLVSLFHSLF